MKKLYECYCEKIDPKVLGTLQRETYQSIVPIGRYRTVNLSNGKQVLVRSHNGKHKVVKRKV